MAYDLPTAKDRLGITGTDEDAAVQASLNAAWALAERFTDADFTIFDPLPPDLEFALWLVFADVYAMRLGDDSSAESAEVQSVTVQDVGSVRFSTGDGIGTDTRLRYGPLPPIAVGILNTYRVVTC